jgi:hypothetical protein
LPKQTLNKSISARKLHQRTMTPLPEQEVTIPYGAILENVRQDRDTVTFNYLTEPYGCPRDIFQSAAAPFAKVEKSPTTAPVPEPAAAIPEPETEPAKLQFEALSSSVAGLSRAKVPGGWLLATELGGVAFYPDARHVWNGESQ